MEHVPIVPVGDSAAVVLPASVLAAAGLRVGDVMEITLADRQLILRPVADADRRRRVEDITRDVFEGRRDAYERLA